MRTVSYLRPVIVFVSFLVVLLNLGHIPAAHSADDQRIYIPLIAAPGTPPVSDPSRLTGFDPANSGYSFQNYGNEHTWQDDLSTADLFNLFGPAICESGTTAQTCSLSGPAREWLDAQLKGMDGGHCEGMATTVLRFWKDLPFYDARHLPGDFITGANRPFDLSLEQSVQQYIAYYFITQGISEVSDPTSEIRQTKKPSEIVALLRASFAQGGTNPYTLGIYKNDNGNLKEGHAITPFGLEDQSNGKVRILIYDNNFPNETKFFDVDTVAETWVYYTAASPDQDPSRYEGDANSHSLDLTPLLLRDPAPGTYFTCPFCQGTQPEGAQTSAITSTIEFSLVGQGDFRITDSDGKQVGLNPADGSFVNTIPGSKVIPAQGGLKKHLAPTILVPLNGGDKPYTVEVFGQELTAQSLGELSMAGPGYTLGFENIDIDPGETLTMTVSPTGNQVVFHGSADGVTPDLSLSIDPVNATAPSYVFKVEGFEIGAGQTVTVTLDFAAGRLFFDDDDGNSDSYALDVLIIYPDGHEVFVNLNDLTVEANDDAALDFGSYSGSGPMDFYIDDEGNGFADDTTPIEVSPKP